MTHKRRLPTSGVISPLHASPSTQTHDTGDRPSGAQGLGPDERRPRMGINSQTRPDTLHILHSAEDDKPNKTTAIKDGSDVGSYRKGKEENRHCSSFFQARIHHIRQDFEK